MLYWTETVIIAFWTIVGITRIPLDQLGTITVGGRDKPATHRLLCGYFTLVAAMFILGHLGFLWIFFSGQWLKKVSASSSILHALFVADGVWLALIFMFVGGLFVRIFIMQAAIIFGGMLARAYGSIAPLLIVIGCKTLVDMSTANHGPLSFKGMTTR